MHAYLPSLYKALGLFIPLIVVNCIVLGRAEAFASKNTVWDSFLDGLGMGLGFTLALTILGAVREILGAGKVFGINLHIYNGDGMLIFILAPGAFLALAYIVAVANKLNKKLEKSN
jgi:electron transport complex protein RnfE